MSRGRGISVFRDLHQLSYDCGYSFFNPSAVVQRYIPNPLLISGYKFDIRCYVLVRSFDPLVVYLYEDGLARFATSQYDISSLTNIFSHLTNTSINKLSPCTVTSNAVLDCEKQDVGPGCKWTIAQLKLYFEAHNIPFKKIWAKIKTIVLLTLLPIAQDVKNHNSGGCFELYGFDILLDEKLKAWLLEVNLSPSLTVDTQIDIDVKRPLMEDTVDLISLTEEDAQAGLTHAQVYSY